MSIDANAAGVLITILLMAGVTLLTRWGGVWVMAYVPVNANIRRFIEAMSGSVLVAILAPLALTGDLAARAALATTALVVLWLKRPLLAISCGIIAAALLRQSGL